MDIPKDAQRLLNRVKKNHAAKIAAGEAGMAEWEQKVLTEKVKAVVSLLALNKLSITQIASAFDMDEQDVQLMDVCRRLI
jgi:hypothetical protein